MCWCDITAAERGSRKPFIWAGKCVRVRDRQQFPGVPKEWVLASSHPFILSFFFFFPPSSVSPFLSPSQHHFSHSLTVLYSHSIKFKQRHAGLFIGEWCFFISLCLFVALRCTEGFLAADVSSAALQRIGGYVRQKDRKKDTKWQCETKGG